MKLKPTNTENTEIQLVAHLGLPEMQYSRIKYTYKFWHDAKFTLKSIRKLRQKKRIARCYFRKRKSGAILRLILVDKK